VAAALVQANARQYDLVPTRLNALPLRGVDPLRDYEAAAAVALRLDDIVVHRDEDFAVLAEVGSLHVLDLR